MDIILTPSPELCLHVQRSDSLRPYFGSIGVIGRGSAVPRAVFRKSVARVCAGECGSVSGAASIKETAKLTSRMARNLLSLHNRLNIQSQREREREKERERERKVWLRGFVSQRSSHLRSCTTLPPPPPPLERRSPECRQLEKFQRVFRGPVAVTALTAWGWIRGRHRGSGIDDIYSQLALEGAPRKRERRTLCIRDRR